MAISKSRDQFVEQFCEDFVCSVCLCIPCPQFAIEATCCGSFFCLPCLRGCREKREVCPNCNGVFHSNPPRPIKEGNRFALKKLLGLVVYCDTKFLDENDTPDGDSPLENGDPPTCNWEGTWADLPDHLKKCDYVNVPCLWNNCPRVVPRRLAEDHERVCNFRTVFCTHCNTALPHNALEKHHRADCAEFPMDCPDCKKVGIPRRELATHLSCECPMGLVRCMISGCTEQVFRKDIAGHQVDCPHREVTCQFCVQSLPFYRLSEHHAVDCQCVLVGCPNNCGCETMERKVLAAHEAICPTFPVTCMFQGCNAKVERRALEPHMKDAMSDHFLILCTQVSSLQNVVATLSSAQEESREQIKSLNKQIADRDKVIADLKKNNATTVLSTKLDSTIEQLHSVEKNIKKIRSTPVSQLTFGPFYFSLQFSVGSVSFHAADVEWIVYLTAAATRGPSLFVKFNACNNGTLVTGAKISFSFQLFPNTQLERTMTVNANKVEVAKGNAVGVKIDNFVAGLSTSPYRITIYDFRVDEFKVN